MAEEVVGKLIPSGASGASSRPVSICDVPAQSETRLETGVGELDRVLGGGIVPGSLVLIGGDPVESCGAPGQGRRAHPRHLSRLH